MKRSEINRALKRMEEMIAEYKISLPPFARFTPEEWKSKGHDHDEIRDNGLGWDITDYGMGDFDKVGFSLITIASQSGADGTPSLQFTFSAQNATYEKFRSYVFCLSAIFPSFTMKGLYKHIN